MNSTNLRYPTLLAILFLFTTLEPASAISFRYQSVEWWTDLADAVLVVEVRRVVPPNGSFDARPHAAVCDLTALLKGPDNQPMAAHFEFHRGCRGIEPGDRILVFLAISSATDEQLVAKHFVLSKQSGVELAERIYGDDCRQLTTNDALIGAVRNRVELPKHKLPLSKRGVTVLLKDPAGGWEHAIRILVRTADRDLMARYLERLANASAEVRVAAIYRLVSYPCKETHQALAKIVKNDESPTVRAAAHVALRLTGEHDTVLPQLNDLLNPCARVFYSQRRTKPCRNDAI